MPFIDLDPAQWVEIPIGGPGTVQQFGSFGAIIKDAATKPVAKANIAKETGEVVHPGEDVAVAPTAKLWARGDGRMEYILGAGLGGSGDPATTARSIANQAALSELDANAGDTIPAGASKFVDGLLWHNPTGGGLIVGDPALVRGDKPSNNATGVRIGTDTALPAAPVRKNGDPVQNGDFFYLSAIDGANVVGTYVWNGTALALDIASAPPPSGLTVATYAELPAPNTVTAGKTGIVTNDPDPALNGNHLALGANPGSNATYWKQA